MFSWDDADLQKLSGVLGRSNTIETICNFASEDITTMIDQEFTQGASPFDVTWKALVKTGAPSHLIDTGQLCASVHVRGAPDGFEVELDDLYNFHQHGTRKMAQRPILPIYGAIPDQWQFAIDAATEELLRSVL